MHSVNSKKWKTCAEETNILEEMENKFPAITNNSINIKGLECLSTRKHNNIGYKRNIQQDFYKKSTLSRKIHKLKVKGWGKTYHANFKQQEAGEALLFQGK